MKTIGLLGGMSWESSIHYERMINEGVRAALGGTASADLIIRSYNFAAIEASRRLATGKGRSPPRRDARFLQDAGADAIVLCTNTMHLVAPAEAAIDVPFLHLADCTADAVVAAGVRQVALLELATRWKKTSSGPAHRPALRSSCPTSPIGPWFTTSSSTSWFRVSRPELKLGISRRSNASPHAGRPG